MSPKRNLALQAWMRDHGHSSNSVAEAVNRAVGDLTGKVGGLDGSDVRAWKAGRVTWPKSVSRMALETVTGVPAASLGFVPRGRGQRASTSPSEEAPVHRRRFISAAAAATTAGAAATSPVPVTVRRIGTSDVERLEQRFAHLVASDHRHGGKRDIEAHALGLADEAMRLQRVGGASQRVRGQLYAVAAAFTSSAMWAAIDGRRFDAAQRLHEQAASLASLSGDQPIQFRIWSHTGSLYRHLHRPADALAANDVARRLSLTRRDPAYASLGHARHAAIQGMAGDSTGVRRSLGAAQDAFGRADGNAPRPVWLRAFFGQCELDSLALTANLSLGNWEEAEARAHRSLAGLGPHMRRSLAITTARLARAQLGQGDVEPAVATATSIPADSVRHPRVADMLTAFGIELERQAPRTSHALQWKQYEREALA
ncbi:XRE family transcriptional regulator [Streptomyces sp. HNM0574]|uniref:XRE family transcriptional regulator n=1 Tax=Streptomyces sp. HNM0574 TaxID=2714954 RepID=UPI00146CD419|nr:XRE family transcriptional regulator [Streptomyces sp. HNM0574]NLU68984.1 XRE family transcriptional regulator [Streptomyces sp. HNM0574]